MNFIKLNNITKVILIIGLYGTFTNIIFISAIPSLWAVILVPFVFVFKRQKITFKKYHIYLWLFFSIVLISTLFYYPKSFIEYDFYRYDGNFIISYLPMLIFPFFNIKINIHKILKNFIFFVIAVNLIVYAYYIIQTKGGVILHPTEEGNTFTPFFKATNASGGFYSILGSLVLSFFLEKKKYVYLFYFILVLFFLWSSTSRGSILGLGLGIFLFFQYRARRTWIIYVCVGLIVLVQTIIIYNTYPLYNSYLKESDNIALDSRLFIQENYGSQTSKESNVYIRAFDTWPRGIALFLNSPIFGSGFGSVNDLPLTLNRGVPGLFSYNDSKDKYFNDSHAHHSYIHFLAELGIVGLVIFLLFWINLFQYIESIFFFSTSVVKNFLLITMFNISIMSFTEHRITTPSNVLTFVIVFSLVAMDSNYVKKHLIKT